MSNLDIYKGIFSDVFGVSADALGDSFTKENIDQWDSVHQLSLVSLAEDNTRLHFLCGWSGDNP